MELPRDPHHKTSHPSARSLNSTIQIIHHLPPVARNATVILSDDKAESNLDSEERSTLHHPLGQFRLIGSSSLLTTIRYNLKGRLLFNRDPIPLV
jgi:hypothetical protein